LTDDVQHSNIAELIRNDVNSVEQVKEEQPDLFSSTVPEQPELFAEPNPILEVNLPEIESNVSSGVEQTDSLAVSKQSI
ncbi:DNA-processing protein DprA, partial [Enterobacter hormaechei]|nr:DNA-processing protein DprA [Enterobacter hormaechei]